MLAQLLLFQTLPCNQVPYQARFHPTEHSSFIAACSDNRLWQWDLKSGETVQEYNHHIQAVNSVRGINSMRKILLE